MCAWRCAAAGLKTIVLEKNARAGRKLLASGSGKCNLSNAGPLESFFLAYGAHSRFVRPALLNFPPESLEEFFATRDLPLVELHEGKLFPSTMRASDVLSVLLGACAESGATVVTEYPVRSISLIAEKDARFEVETGWGSPGGNSNALGKFRARFAVIACGGASWPVTGSTGDGYRLASSLGHSLVEPRPALAPVYPSAYDCASCAGVSVERVPVRLWRMGKKIGDRTGDVLFTHTGLSGPGILDASRDFREGDEISLCLIPGESSATVSERIIALCKASPRKALKNVLSTLGIPERLVLAVLSRCGIAAAELTAGIDRQPPSEGDITAASLTKELRRRIADELCDFRFGVSRIGGMEEAMATAGGIDTGAVRARTLESSIVSGLYFAGEVLDVDGDTGGYNLQFAFSSGVLVADSIVKAARERL